MAGGKPHIDVSKFQNTHDFRSKQSPRPPSVPQQNRAQHGQRLTSQYNTVLNEFAKLKEHQTAPITEEIGIYVEIESVSGCDLPLDRLDNKTFDLRSCKKENNKEFALIFIPESKRDAFLEKVQQYLDPQKDNKSGPSNHALIDAIHNIKLADLRSFWTDDLNLYPKNDSQEMWWELWLKKSKHDPLILHVS